jgi:hypothetical protein
VRVSIIILPVVKPDPRRYELPQKLDDVGLDAFVPVFLNHDRSRCALGIQRYETILDTGLANGLSNFTRDIDQLFPLARGYLENSSHWLAALVGGFGF